MGEKKGAGAGEGVRESHCEKGIRVHRRREIRWTRMRTLLCLERAYTVGTLMSARMKAWALLCLLLAKLPQQVACSAGSPAPFQDYRSRFLSFPFHSPFLLSHISRVAKKCIKKKLNSKEFRHPILESNSNFRPYEASLFYTQDTRGIENY